MNASTCDQVADWIDLYAADECSRDEARAVRRHLDDCDACRQSLQQSRALLGTLNLHFGQDAAMARLASRLKADTVRKEPPHSRIIRFVHRIGAVAALMFVTFGLGVWIAPRFAAPSPPGLQLALVEPKRGLEHIVPGPARGKMAKEQRPQKANDAHANLDQAIKKAQDDGDWPLPPRVDVELVVKNAGTTPVLLQIGGPDFALVVDVRGRGVVRQTLPPTAPLPFPARTVPIAPGGSFQLPIERLTSQIGETVQNVYVLDEGEVVVRVRLDAVALRQGVRERIHQNAGPLKMRLP